MNTIKKIVAACLVGAVAFSVNAQPDPGATVNEQGQLVLTNGDIIDPPVGQVINGDLDTDGDGTADVTAPVVTVEGDGSITLGDGTNLAVPDLPEGGDFIVSWFGSDLFDYDTALAPDQDQAYFSFTLKNMYHFATGNWFYLQELDATLYVDPNSGDRSLDGGVWTVTQNLFPAQPAGSNIFVFFSAANGWNDLRDSDGDGINDLGDGDAGGQVLEGFLYLTDAPGYDTNGAGWFYFSEFDDSATDPGNFIIRVGPTPGSWLKLTVPVQ